VKLIDEYGGKSKTAIDFGCGTGKAFRYLCPAFKSVIGTDISQELLAVATARGYRNVKTVKSDLTKRTKLRGADLALCCNVIMLQSMEQNLMMFKNICQALKPGGTALIVLPSLESFIFVANQLIEWHRRDGTSLDRIDNDEFKGFAGPKLDVIRGVVKIDGVPTKHYLEPEIARIMNAMGFKSVSIRKLEYDWTTEFAEPPKWMKAPYPWDWLIEAIKGSAPSAGSDTLAHRRLSR
jgi:SAM-dependent methyltransferase